MIKIKDWWRSLPIRIAIALVIFVAATLWSSYESKEEPAPAASGGLLDAHSKEMIDAAEAADALKQIKK